MILVELVARSGFMFVFVARRIEGEAASLDLLMLDLVLLLLMNAILLAELLRKLVVASVAKLDHGQLKPDCLQVKVFF